MRIITAWLLCAMSASALAQDLRMDWDRVDSDEAERPIDPDMISYVVFVSENGGDYQPLAETPDNMYVYSDVAVGCYDVYVKSMRTDSNQYSVPSDIASICVKVPGASGNEEGSAEDGTLTLPPLPPGVRLSIENSEGG